MIDTDEWGRDPQVRFLRRAFFRMETAQRELLERLQISPFDDRLKRIRDAALRLFEKVWRISSRWDMSMNEEEISRLYMYSFAYILERNRIQIPPEVLPPDDKINRLIQEAVK